MSFNRKRRFGKYLTQSVTSHNNNTNRQPGDDDDYQQRYQKRFRLPPIVELAKTLCGDLNTLGESAKRYVEDVEFMSVPIDTNFEQEEPFRTAVLNTLYAITTEQPHKVLHIAGLIQAVNTKNTSIAGSIVTFFHSKAQSLLHLAISDSYEPNASETGPWNKLKLILRLWGALAYVLEDASVVAVFKQFLELAINLQKDSPDKRVPLAEAIYYNTLSSIPYLYPFQGSGSAALNEGVDTLLGLAKEFPIVKTNVSITNPFVEQATATPYEPREIVELILPAVEKYLSSEEKNSLFPELEAQLGDLLIPTEKMSLPPLNIPSVDDLKKFAGLDTGIGSVDGMWRTPRLTFEVYVPIGELKTTPPAETYTGLILRDLVIDVIEALEFNRKEVARQIITIDLFFKDSLFAPPGLSIDKLREMESGSTYKIEDVAVESLLSLIYKLPTASQPFVYFYTTLVEACANASQAIAPVMGRAIRFFYANLYHLDFELRFRYLDWLSVQLSNFNFTWKWREWEGDSQIFSKSAYHPRGVFVRNLIAKELRLATREKIESTVTAEFLQYLDISLFDAEESSAYYNKLFPGIEQQTESKLVFLGEGIPFKRTVEKLIEAIHKDSDAHDEAIAELRSSLSEYPNSEELLVSVVFQVLVFVGNRSISHAGKYIASTAGSLKKIVGVVDESGDKDMEKSTSTTDQQRWAIDAVLHYWNEDPQNGYLVLDILESFGVISSISIIEHSLENSRKRNVGLVNVSATEAILRTLTKRVFAGSGAAELTVAYNKALQIISATISDIGTDDEIPIPGVQDEVTQEVENAWKYHTALGFLRMTLRKFSDEYVSIRESLISTLDKDITHKSTQEGIKTWISDLSSL
ncbi:CYFA0S07e00210g1_1 [Cyberlindnera fabianii]|uniref:CYFA0S07e00210g1_1 n=1 Tax=Cyberlindnera fabianii TaxID=36022 RepID=A0A061B0V0_CYBFA|nr:CYFA0S07e00210g1_1 [Cyberlindnera fabianii]